MNINTLYFLILSALFNTVQLPAEEVKNETMTRLESSANELSTFYSIENVTDITSEDIDKLLEFHPAIKFESHSRAEVDFFEDTELRAFQRELFRKWVRPYDWSAWQDEALAYYEDSDLLKEAELVVIVKLITLHVRKDRFSEGHLLAIIQDGHMSKILSRLRKIRVADSLLTKN